MVDARTVRLKLLYDGIAARCDATNEEHGFWPCRAGCDDCCRNLGEPPHVTGAEWAYLREGIEALPSPTGADVEARLLAWARTPHEERGKVCPLLDGERGLCRVYAHRPSACRAYGYYADGAHGKHCGKVTAAVDQHEALVLWGNENAVQRDLVALSGPTRPLAAWAEELPTGRRR